MSAMRVHMIVNPKSGRGRSAGAALMAAMEFRKAGWQIEVHATTGPGHATQIARSVARQCDLIVSCGGDGTLCEAEARFSRPPVELFSTLGVR